MAEQKSFALFYVADGACLEEYFWLLTTTSAKAHRGDDRGRQVAYVTAVNAAEIHDHTHAHYEVCGV